MSVTVVVEYVPIWQVEAHYGEMGDYWKLQCSDDTKKWNVITIHQEKSHYTTHVVEVEQPTFTPLVLNTTGGLLVECNRYLRVKSGKMGESYVTSISWMDQG